MDGRARRRHLRRSVCALQSISMQIGKRFSYNRAMAHYLDIATWPRREVFQFFRAFDKPYFNICTRLDVTNLLALLKSDGQSAKEDEPSRPKSVSLAYHYF